MTRSAHLSVAHLLARALDPARRLAAPVERHVAICASCRDELMRWTTLGDALRRPVEEPPPGALARAWSLLAPRPPRAAERARFEPARLVFDDRQAVATSGVRAPAVRREQLWRTADAEVSLQVTGGGLGSSPSLMGRVLPRRANVARAPGWVWVLEPGRAARGAGFSAHGEFLLEAPAGPRWTLLVDWDDVRLRLEERP